MTEEDEDFENIPESGAVFTFGRTRFAENEPNRFWIRDDPVILVACGDEHTAVVTRSGRLFTFGSNGWGQLGHGNTKTYTKPSSVKALKNVVISQVACGKSHTLVVSDRALCFGFGCNDEAQLGLGDTSAYFTPQEISTLKNIPISQLSAGGEHSAALTSSGNVYLWGSNAEGQLGFGDEPTRQLFPELIKSHEQFKQVSCGYHHSAFVTEEGQLYVCGESEHGKLGLGGDLQEPYVRSLTRVELSGDVSSVSCGGGHTAVIMSSGRLFTFGQGSTGQLGLGHDVLETNEPTQVRLLGIRIQSVHCGHSHTVAVSELKAAFGFGDGTSGKLESTEGSTVCSPTRMERFIKFDVALVACGGNHTVVQAVPLETWKEREAALSKKGRKLKFQDVDEEVTDVHVEHEHFETVPGTQAAHNGSFSTYSSASSSFMSARERRRKHEDQGTQSLETESLPPLKASLTANRLPKLPPLFLDLKEMSGAQSAQLAELNDIEKQQEDDGVPNRAALEKEALESSLSDEEENKRIKDGMLGTDEAYSDQAESISEKIHGGSAVNRRKLFKTGTPTDEEDKMEGNQEEPEPKKIVVQAVSEEKETGSAAESPEESAQSEEECPEPTNTDLTLKADEPESDNRIQSQRNPLSEPESSTRARFASWLKKKKSKAESNEIKGEISAGADLESGKDDDKEEEATRAPSTAWEDPTKRPPHKSSRSCTVI